MTCHIAVGGIIILIYWNGLYNIFACYCKNHSKSSVQLILSFQHYNMILWCLIEKKGEIDKLAEEYIATVKNMASEKRVEHLQKIQNAYNKCKEFSDDKVQLAMQTYEMVSVISCTYTWLMFSVLWSVSQCIPELDFSHILGQGLIYI